MATLIVESRADHDEVRHEGTICISSNHGPKSIGEPAVFCSLRSTAKPFILSTLLGGPLLDEEFSSTELAAMSSSHNGEPRHVDAISSLLERYGISLELLSCGHHEKWKDFSINSPAGNNCSGKHAAFLIASKLSGFDLLDYTKLDSQLNRWIIPRLEEIFEDKAKAVGIDGCSIPTCVFSLESIASTFRRYACDEISEQCTRVRKAHLEKSFFVGGTDRLESYLIQHYGLSVKSGSDGLWAIGIPSHKMGLAGKVWSGSESAVQHALLHVLQLYSIIDVRSDPYLQKYYNRDRSCLLGNSVGRLEACFDLPLSK